MERDFWHERWRAGQIGFHRLETNPHLTRWAGEVLPPAPSRILVPLCGKSLDLAWLRNQGHEVVGAELSELAAEAFFREQALSATVEDLGKFRRYRHEGLAIYCGDFFELSAELTGPFDGVYDRAALVALPPLVRPRYAAHVESLLQPNASGLLVSFDYPQTEMDGPPFSVPEGEVQALYSPPFQVERLAAHDILQEEARFRERGLTQLREAVYRLRRAPDAPKR